MLYPTIRFIQSWWICLRNGYRKLCPLPTETEYDHLWIMYDNEGHPFRTPEPEFSDRLQIAIDIVTRTKPDGQTDVRKAIWYRGVDRSHYALADLFEMCAPPWYAITCNGVDMTYDMSPYICSGNVVTLSLLNKIVSRGTWTIMDTQTFEEVDFPSTELVIRDAF